MATSWSRLLTVPAGSALVLGACAGDDDDASPPTSMPTTTATAAPESPGSSEPVVSELPSEGVGSLIELRPVSVSADRRIVDDLDREVILRGANVNSLGEY